MKSAAVHALSVEHLSAGYGAARIIDDLSLRVGTGEVVTLLGRNGMGKTTVVRSLLGFDAPVQTAGDIVWEGVSLNGLPNHRRAKLGIGLVPQGRHVFRSMSVEENLTTTARRFGRGEQWSLAKVYDLFPRLAERRRSKAGNLSGGEQQMVAVGRALMTNPRLLVMDEPSEGLAPAVVDQICESLELLKGADLSILLVEQNIGMALSLADRVYVLEIGRIVHEGPATQLRQDADLQRRYLGV